MSSSASRRNEEDQPSLPSLVSDILVVYPSTDASSPFPATELGFELILDTTSRRFLEDSCDKDTEEDADDEDELQNISSAAFLQQHHKRQLASTPKAIKQNSNPQTMISASSPAATLPLTPLSTCSPAQPQTPTAQSTSKIRTQSSRKIRTQSLFDEDEDDGRHYRHGLQRLVCTKPKQSSQGSESTSSIQNETLPKHPAGDVTRKQQQRRPLLRKLICQKYKPNSNQDDSDDTAHQRKRISPECSPVQHRMKSRDLSFSVVHNHHSECVDPKNEPAQWNTSSTHTTSRAFTSERSSHHCNATTLRIVQRFEGTQSNHNRQALHHASLVALQQEFESSVGLDDPVRRNSEGRRVSTASPIHRQTNQNSFLLRAFPSDERGQNHSEARESSVWNNAPPSSPPINFLGGSAYQRRKARFQKEHGTRAETLSSPEFLFGSGQADDESSFVEWVEQIENENVNISSSSQISNQGFGVEYVPSGNVSHASNALAVPTDHKAMNKSLNTTVDTTQSYSSKGGHQDDHQTPDTEELLSSDEEDNVPAQFRTRQASFGGESAKSSLGSIASHQFGQSQFIDDSPEAIIAAAMAGDFDDDDDDVWSGHISVHDEEFALASVYSKPRVPF